MSIIELAKEHGIHVFNNPEDGIKQLEAFATAIIENYKAGLVPVGEIANDARTGHSYNILFYSNSVSIGTKLYALPLGETK